MQEMRCPCMLKYKKNTIYDQKYINLLVNVSRSGHISIKLMRNLIHLPHFVAEWTVAEWTFFKLIHPIFKENCVMLIKLC